MSTPMVLAASSTLVPLATVICWPSMVRVTVSLIRVSLVALAADHVDHAEDRHDVGDEVAVDEVAARLQVHERRAPAVALVRAAGAVGDDEEAELAVAALDEGVALAGRDADAVHDVLEVADHRLDRVVRVLLGRQRDARIVDDDGAAGQLHDRLAEDAHRLLDLLDAHEVAVEAVAVGADGDVELELGVDRVRVVLADVVVEAARARDRAGLAPADRVLAAHLPDARHAVVEDLVVVEQALALGQDALDLAQRLDQLADPAVGQVLADAADAHVRVGEARARDLLEQLVGALAAL